MYEVRYSIVGVIVNQTMNTTNGDETSLIVDRLEEFTNYTIEVRAYTTAGPGPYSAPMDVQTLQDCKHIVVCVCACVSSVWLCIYVCLCSLCVC